MMKTISADKTTRLLTALADNYTRWKYSSLAERKSAAEFSEWLRPFGATTFPAAPNPTGIVPSSDLDGGTAVIWLEHNGVVYGKAGDENFQLTGRRYYGIPVSELDSMPTVLLNDD